MKLHGMVAVGLLATVQVAQAAQEYPSRPVRVIVSFAAGGPADFVARLIGQKLSEQWKQPVVVDNRGGAGGNIGTVLAAQSPADGYTFLLTTSVFTANPSLYSKPGFDPFKDFEAVTLTSTSATIVSRHPSFAVNTMKDLVTLSKAGAIPYASPGVGTAGHLAAELFHTMTGAKLQQVPYKGAGPAMTGLLGGEVKLGFTAVPPLIGLSKAGKLIPIAVTSPKRLAVLPNVPTVAETYPGFQVDNMYGVLAPKGTPKAVVRKVNADINAVLAQPAIRQRLEADAFDVIGNSPEEFERYLRSEFTKWAKVIKASGARVD